MRKLLHFRLVLLIGSVLVLAAFDPVVAAIIGTTTVGTVVGFNNLMGRFVTPCIAWAWCTPGRRRCSGGPPSYRRGVAAAARRPRTPLGGSDAPPVVREGIKYEDVNFAYGLKPTLQNISVSIPAGTSAAFVGPTVKWARPRWSTCCRA